MKLSEHVALIKNRIYGAYDKHLARLGLGAGRVMDLDKLPAELHGKRHKIDQLIENHKGEMGSYEAARERALEELTFTLFNRLAAIKVMEAHTLFPEVVTQRAEHGGRSFGHKAWLEEHPEMREEEMEGLRTYLAHEFDLLGEEIPLYHRNYPYALLPYVLDLKEVVDAFNAVAADPQIENGIWQSDDILGWLYESYNNDKKEAHRESGEKTEYDKVSLQSQVYTPRWVVKFLVDNSLGKLYLEMFPDSEIREKYAIANAPDKRLREPKSLTEVRLIDPACGSGNFELYAFDLFYALYLDQIENYGAKYQKKDIPRLIIEHNLHGIDLDDRAVQLAHLGLYIKARRKNRNVGALQFQVVSSAFFLPDYEEVEHIFDTPEKPLSDEQKNLVEEIWGDLQQAHRFGSLVRVGEKVNARLEALIARFRRPQMDIFAEKDIVDFEIFRENFFRALEKAVAIYAQDTGESFLSAKTRDAITYLKVLTASYDVAVANPPYTDSGDFGPELKSFLEENYKKPLKFHVNLYATFIKRSYELVNQIGFISMIHPYSFMYIKSFEDVRKLMIEKTHIDLLADWGLDRVNLFEGGYASAPTFYILSKRKNKLPGIFFNLTTSLQEKEKKDAFENILIDLSNGKNNERIYYLEQEKLKTIPSWPFIYWISDGFREKFGKEAIGSNHDVIFGLKTGKNIKYLRFGWEVLYNDNDTYDWIYKAGPSNKWYGNLWLKIDLKGKRDEIKKEKSSNFSGETYYYNTGIICPTVGTKGVAFKINDEQIFSNAEIGIYCKDKSTQDIGPTLAYLNSKLVAYINNMLNPTVNIMPNDIKRIPYQKPDKTKKSILDFLSIRNVRIKKTVSTFSLIEPCYNNNPLNFFKGTSLFLRIKSFLNYENHLFAQILLNEALINNLIFETYELTPEDRKMVLAKEGNNVGSLPVLSSARKAYVKEEIATIEFSLKDIQEYILGLPEKDFSEEEKQVITEGFPSLYQTNNNLEEFCIRHQVNPINVWYWFKESNVIPQQRMQDIAMEFLADMIRAILMEDDDGVIPLVPNAGEKVLLDRIEEKFYEKGFSSAQFSSFDKLLGRPLPEYLNGHFFKHLSDHLNLFMYLPKTPFIWHLTSGPEQGFDCYIIIYKWNRDKLYRLRSIYLENRERALVNRRADLQNNDSAAAQNEKDRIGKQLRELESFRKKIDELLEEGYEPVLDDGVGKNIAPLQKKGMLAYEVLNAGQLKKYLNADW